MSELLSRLYSINISNNKELSYELQMQIAKYAVKKSEYKLVSDLITYPNLDSNVELFLRNQQDIEVVKLWLRKPGRTSGEILNLVNQIKTGRLITELACIAKMEKKFYLEVFAKAKTKAALLALIANSSTPNSVVKDSLIRLTKLFPGELTYFRYSHRIKGLSLANHFQKNTSISKLLIEDYKAFPVLAQNIIGLELKEEYRKVLLDNLVLFSNELVDTFKKASVEKQTPLKQAGQLDHIDEFLNYYGENHIVQEDELVKLTKVVNIYKDFAKSYTEKPLLSWINAMERGLTELKANKISTYINSTAKASNGQELVKLVDGFVKMNNSYKLTNRNFELLLREVLRNPACDLETSEYALEKMGDNGLSSVLDSITDPVLLGIALHYSSNCDIVKYLKSSSNPKLTLDVYLEKNLEKKGYIDSDIYDSGLVELEHLLNFNVETLTYSAMGSQAESMIAEHINKLLDKPDHWENFEALADDFQGNVGQLLNVVTKL